jgi:uncharacterized protein (TIGR02391 family)
MTQPKPELSYRISHEDPLIHRKPAPTDFEHNCGAFTHIQLSALFKERGITEQGGTPRWERTLLALRERQRLDGCANGAAAFIEAAMDPVRFVNDQERYSEVLIDLNKVLAFKGLRLGDEGRLHQGPSARTLAEAEQMANELRSELRRRGVHPDVLVFCRSELLQANPPNYFHAVLEATKSVAQKIRDKTGGSADAAELVDYAFAVHKPLLAINSLQTDSERAEHTGFANIMKGMFGTFRNPTGHAPRVLWKVEKHDAFDLLSLVSYLHRRLDQAVRTYNSQ